VARAVKAVKADRAVRAVKAVTAFPRRQVTYLPEGNAVSAMGAKPPYLT
jgi:hypothetical protein